MENNNITAAERKWDELTNDCLVQIFTKVETVSLAEFIPFVCKSWYRATFDPQCWTRLTFYSDRDPGIYVKHVVGRSQRSATVVEFKDGFGFDITRAMLLCIAEGCPLLKTFILPLRVREDYSLLLSELISSWKHLEYLHISNLFHFEEILESISLHCPDFVGLVCNHSVMGIKHVSAIVKFIPKIKFLTMRSSRLSLECLVMLLKGCAALETLDVRDCIGFKDGDREIMKLASHINSFNCSGPRLDDKDEDDDEDEDYDDRFYPDDEDEDYDGPFYRDDGDYKYRLCVYDED